MTEIFSRKRVPLCLVFIFLLCLYFIPAGLNGFPKGSDTYYHMRIGREILGTGSLVLHDPLNAGGAANPYPPLLHLVLAGLYSFLDPFLVSLYLGPLLALLSAAGFYLMAGSFLGKRVALAATFIFGTSLEIVNTAIFTGPANLGLLLIFLSIYLSKRYLVTGRPLFLGLALLSTKYK